MAEIETKQQTTLAADLAEDPWVSLYNPYYGPRQTFR